MLAEQLLTFWKAHYFPLLFFQKESTSLLNVNKTRRDGLFSFSKDLYQSIPNTVKLKKNALCSHSDTWTCYQGAESNDQGRI